MLVLWNFTVLSNANERCNQLLDNFIFSGDTVINQRHREDTGHGLLSKLDRKYYKILRYYIFLKQRLVIIIGCEYVQHL